MGAAVFFSFCFSIPFSSFLVVNSKLLANVEKEIILLHHYFCLISLLNSGNFPGAVNEDRGPY